MSTTTAWIPDMGSSVVLTVRSQCSQEMSGTSRTTRVTTQSTSSFDLSPQGTSTVPQRGTVPLSAVGRRAPGTRLGYHRLHARLLQGQGSGAGPAAPDRGAGARAPADGGRR